MNYELFFIRPDLGPYIVLPYISVDQHLENDMHFFLAGVLFGKDSPKFGLFLPIQATLSPIYALFGILLIGLSCAGCTKIHKYKMKLRV